MPEKTPLISVIVPVFNAEKYLETCLKSLILQTYPNLEILCINDGSEDNSLNLLEKYADRDSRIKIIDQKNSGQSHARNRGIECAKGEYISFVDSDDWVSLALYKKFVCALNSSDTFFDTYMYNYTSYEETPDINNFVNKSGIIPNSWENSRQNQVYHYTDCKIPFGGNLAIWNKIYSKNLLKENDIRFVEDYIFEDQLFCIHAFLNSKGIYIDNNVQYYYRQAENSTTHTLGGNAFDIFHITKQIEDLYKEKNLYEKYKYALFQHKYCEYANGVLKVILPLKENFYNTARLDLINTVKDNLDIDVIKKLHQNHIYFDIMTISCNEFIKKYRSA